MSLGLGGELAALGGALLWAVASVLYRRAGEQVPPRELNLLKGLLGAGLLALTAWALRDPFPAAQPWAIGLLLLSGALGIGLGDTAYFQALNDLGARQALLIGILAPPAAALIAWAALGEALRPAAWAGIVLTVAGVAWVVTERGTDEPGASSPLAAHRARGIGAGLLAALAQAGGAVLSRAALDGTQVSPLWSAVLRLAAGVGVLVVWLAVARRPLGGFRARERRGRLWGLWGVLLGAILLGTYLALWLQQVSLQRVPAGIAQTLFATSPLFVLPLAAWTGERVSPRAIVGVVVALGGVGLLFVGSP